MGESMNEERSLAEAAVRASDPEPPKMMPARCPHCGQSPASINAAIITFDTLGAKLAAVLFTCANEGCRRIHSIAPMGLQPSIAPQPAIVPPGAGAMVPSELRDKIKAGPLRKRQ